MIETDTSVCPTTFALKKEAPRGRGIVGKATVTVQASVKESVD